MSTYTQKFHVISSEASSKSGAFSETNTGNVLASIDVNVHEPMFEVTRNICVGINLSESDYGVVRRFQCAMAILRPRARIVRTLTAAEIQYSFRILETGNLLYHNEPSTQHRNRPINTTHTPPSPTIEEQPKASRDAHPHLSHHNTEAAAERWCTVTADTAPLQIADGGGLLARSVVHVISRRDLPLKLNHWSRYQLSPGSTARRRMFAGGLYTTIIDGFIPTSGRRIQAATSHCLGNIFWRPRMFNIFVEDAKDHSKSYDSWGLSTRAIGVMFRVHGDNQGLVLPPRIDIEDLTISNDGATNRASRFKIFVDLAQKQDKEVGDGTTSVVIIAAELLRWANELVKAKIHRRQEAVKFKQEQLSINVAKRSTSKIIAKNDDCSAPMAVDAMQAVKSIDIR
ncbi:hypothetical protein HYPSUDRAFT_1074154 [Hypholoma sublateritium FD-334 SS-4]|uniref:Uncharacterized protein n=1 Tax=Hypholoma sublateritium (strain FD-334 SS-4) TaxID=945553 RepID=A0A0D2P076_HYPSF|nr:hypothetical protein HYPSUDRAFT_1074154 [Hypholoma sublateritium FD-334 SS-4]